MSNKALQEQRKRSYFIEATKEILKGEGSKALSVRNIAERAGYSYATLYNYFKDQTELISLSLLDFKDECRDAVSNSIRQSKPGKDEIKSIVKAYINYFVHVNEEVITFLDSLCEEDWQFLIENGTYKESEVIALRITLENAVIGLLISYLKRNRPMEYSDFMKSSDLILDSILG